MGGEREDLTYQVARVAAQLQQLTSAYEKDEGRLRQLEVRFAELSVELKLRKQQERSGHDRNWAVWLAVITAVLTLVVNVVFVLWRGHP